MRRLLSLLAVLLTFASAPAWAQGAIQQSGPVTPFHAPAWFGNGVQGDGGLPGKPGISALGLFNGPQCPFSISSQTGPGIPTGPYSQFSICQTPTTTTLTIAGVGQTVPNLYFNIGGVLYPFPGTSAGCGATVEIISSGANLQICTYYTWKTSAGAFSANLPALNSVADGQFLEAQDGDNNASVNNMTINASGSDQICYYASCSSSFTIDVNAGVIRIVRSNGVWRALSL